MRSLSPFPPQTRIETFADGLTVRIVYPLVIALIVMGIVAVMARVLSSTDPAWVRAS